MNLLERKDFREGVFARDKHKCVFCDKPAVDAHHIMERRLFHDGGYYLENGASVCAEHHIMCETTELSVEKVREACGITKPVLPSHLYSDQIYDKWGNPILANGQRLKGDLFFDESVQKILGQGKVLGLFTNLVKYPRTYHLPWSEGFNDDDRLMESLYAFEGKRVIVTEKMDGENTSMYSNYYHARSIDGNHHASRNWAKQFWSTIAQDIPEGWRICSENLYAKHSIAYDSLSTYVMGFSIWNDRNVCLSWDETQDYFALLGITSVPVLYDGIFDEEKIRAIWNPKNHTTSEGYVLRIADEINYSEFRVKFGKFVRKNHVQTVQHWMHGKAIEKNLLAK